MHPNVSASKLSVIIPAYNEERVILGTLHETIVALDGLDFEVIVVDDGSADTTHSKVQQLAASDERIFAVRYDRNRGKGYALKHGVENSLGNLIAFIDADLDIHPRQLQRFLEIMRESGADVVIGSKLHPESKLEYPWHRRIVSQVYFWLVRFLFGLPVLDTQTGIKVFRREVLTSILPYLRVEGFAFDLELLVLAHRQGYKIVDAPVVLTFRRGFWGRIGLKAILTVLDDTLKVYLETRQITLPPNSRN